MGQLKDLTGKRFGQISVEQSSLLTNISGSRLWVCKCDCGKVLMMATSSLNSGIRSCGCVQRKIFVESHIGKPSCNQRPHGQSNSKIVYRQMKDGAKVRNLVFEITYEQFLKISSQNCHYCGIEPRQQNKAKYANCNGVYLYNGFDRVDNDKGYILDNIVPCCMKCNRAKCKMSVGEFLDLVKRIYKNRIENK